MSFTIEKTYNAPPDKVWKAITHKDEMKKWYFDLAEFKAETGFEFSFAGGPENGVQYVHLCKVTEVLPGKRITYSWKYKGYEGISFVTFELVAEEKQTRLKLTHSGLESFPKDNPDFAASNFEAGWKHIIGDSLSEYLKE